VRFQFSLPEVFIGYTGVGSGTYRILFLKSNGDHYEFVSPYYPSVVAVAGSRIQSERPLDRVFEAVAAVLWSPDAPVQYKREAINTLWGVKNPLAASGLRSMLQEGVRTLQLPAAAALLAAGDSSALPIAEAELLRPDPSLSFEVLPNLRGALSRGIMPEAAIPALARLLSQGDTDTRRAASLALRRTRLTSALGPLASALDDADVQVELNVVMGLAEITGQAEWGPSMPAFLADKERYLGHWKDWMRNR
jgi:HEAT repeat protein